MEILLAQQSDIEEILKLQRIAFMTEAEFYNDFTIEPLKQTIEELRNEFKNFIILKAVENGKIIGSVRAVEKNQTCFIFRLMTHPDHWNKGVGKALMKSIEAQFDVQKYALFTGQLREKNISFYHKLGYMETGETELNGETDVVCIHMEKIEKLQ